MQTDLLAVAYGQFEFTKQTDGMILFWHRPRSAPAPLPSPRRPSFSRAACQAADEERRAERPMRATGRPRGRRAHGGRARLCHTTYRDRSLKNPQAPERVYHAACGVTSLSFSTLHPNLLAAGW